MDPAEAIQRWDGFLAKIRARATEIFEQAEHGCAMLLDLNELDPLPMSNAWSAIETQLVQLEQKIDDTWSDKVEGAFDEAGWDWNRIGPQRQKGDGLTRWIERQRAEVGIRIFGAAAEKIFAEAKKLLAEDYKCSQCMAKLPVSDTFFRSVHVTCNYCSNVNTFVPGTKVRAVEHFCAHHLAQLRSRDLYFAWLAAEERMKDGEEDRAKNVAAEAALKAYTEAYLRARIAIVPELAESFDKDLKGKMAFFYEDFSQYRRE